MINKKIKKVALKKTKILEKKKIISKEELKKEDAVFIKMAKSLPRLLKGKFAKRIKKKN
ncbi:hypothetical protein ISS04_01175 [Candidatus Woesearchaeota archaeon]|nr:hypothetical protein [Candidatus Woesearchaeota archaeon]